MSTNNNPNSNLHIWQQNDLSPSTTTIMHLEREHIKNITELNEQIQKIENETKCLIKLHDIQSKVVWIRVKNKEQGPRDRASALINELTDNKCVVVRLPAIPEPAATNIAECNELTAIVGGGERIEPKRRAITRSITDTQISKVSTPFSSFPTPLSLNNSIKEEDNDFDEDGGHETMPQFKSKSSLSASKSSHQIGTSSKVKPPPPRRIYTMDFLLKRADAPASKRLPSNWKELNQKYPFICFCGKVISYFNPAKYHEHWAKVQLANPDIHGIKFPTMSSSRSNYSFSTMPRAEEFFIQKPEGVVRSVAGFENGQLDLHQNQHHHRNSIANHQLQSLDHHAHARYQRGSNDVNNNNLATLNQNHRQSIQSVMTAQNGHIKPNRFKMHSQSNGGLSLHENHSLEQQFNQQLFLAKQQQLPPPNGYSFSARYNSAKNDNELERDHDSHELFVTPPHRNYNGMGKRGQLYASANGSRSSYFLSNAS